MDGILVGFGDGDVVGIFDSMVEGVEDGDPLGSFVDGASEGAFVGAAVGTLDGCFVGEGVSILIMEGDADTGHGIVGEGVVEPFLPLTLLVVFPFPLPSGEGDDGWHPLGAIESSLLFPLPPLPPFPPFFRVRTKDPSPPDSNIEFICMMIGLSISIDDAEVDWVLRVSFLISFFLADVVVVLLRCDEPCCR